MDGQTFLQGASSDYACKGGIESTYATTQNVFSMGISLYDRDCQAVVLEAGAVNLVCPSPLTVCLHLTTTPSTASPLLCHPYNRFSFLTCSLVLNANKPYATSYSVCARLPYVYLRISGQERPERKARQLKIIIYTL